MRKNMYAGFLAAALAASSVLAGCGDSASEATKADQDAQETSAQGEASGEKTEEAAAMNWCYTPGI